MGSLVMPVINQSYRALGGYQGCTVSPSASERWCLKGLGSGPSFVIPSCPHNTGASDVNSGLSTCGALSQSFPWFISFNPHHNLGQ